MPCSSSRRRGGNSISPRTTSRSSIPPDPPARWSKPLTIRFPWHLQYGAAAQLYTARGGTADYFDPSVDSRIFHDRGRVDKGKPWTLFCYARPGHPRNGFELLAAALRIVKEKLGEDVRIVTAGADWDPAAYGLRDVLLNLGNLGYATTGALYRACDVGVAMMMTCPSVLSALRTDGLRFAR